MLPLVALVGAAPWALVRLGMRVPVRRVASEALFAGYVSLLCFVVFYLPVGVRPEDAGSVWACINLVPGQTVVEIVRDYPGLVVMQLVDNVVLFLPMGFFLPLLVPPCRRFAATAAMSLLAAFGIELVQLGILLAGLSRRSVDVDDVVLNVTGACLGYLVWQGAARQHLPAEAP